MSRRTLGTIAAIARDGAVRGAWSPRCCEQAARNLALPLSDASIIREQAAEKRPRPGADRRGDLRGDEIRPAPLPGGRAGADADPARPPPTTWPSCPAAPASPPATWPTPSVNVAYGSYYLRYLLDHYDGNEMLARGRLQRRPEQRRQLGRAGATPQAGSSRVAARSRSRRRANTCSACSPPQRGVPRHAMPRAAAGSTVAQRARRLATVRSAMPDFKLDSVFTPTADQPKAIAALAEGVRRRRALPDAARRDRHGQDDDDGGRDRGGAAPGAGDRPQQDARGAAVQRVPHVLPATTRSSTSSPTTTTTSPRRTSRAGTCTSRRTRRSTRRSTACATRPPRRCSRAAT